jgi:hypothetical protein
MVSEPSQVPSFDDVCKYVGQLYLEKQHANTRLKDEFVSLHASYTSLIAERDRLLGLLAAKHE